MILDDDINYFYDTIFNDDKIFNNELFLYTKEDLSKKISEDFINYYFHKGTILLRQTLI